MLSKILPLIKPILNNARVIWTKYNFRVYPLSEYTFLSSLEPLGLQSSRKCACKNPIQTHLESSRPWKSMEATKMSNTESLFYHKVTSMVQKTQYSTLGAGFSYPNLHVQTCHTSYTMLNGTWNDELNRHEHYHTHPHSNSKEYKWTS